MILLLQDFIPYKFFYALNFIHTFISIYAVTKYREYQLTDINVKLTEGKTFEKLKNKTKWIYRYDYCIKRSTRLKK